MHVLLDRLVVGVQVRVTRDEGCDARDTGDGGPARRFAGGAEERPSALQVDVPATRGLRV